RKVRAVARDSDGPRTTLRKMHENNIDSIYVTRRDRTLQGVAEVDVIMQAADEGKDTIEGTLTQDFRTVGPDEPLQNLFSMFSEKSFPIAVVDAEKRLLGVVVKGAVLDQLAQAQAGEDE